MNSSSSIPSSTLFLLSKYIRFLNLQTSFLILFPFLNTTLQWKFLNLQSTFIINTHTTQSILITFNFIKKYCILCYSEKFSGLKITVSSSTLLSRFIDMAKTQYHCFDQLHPSKVDSKVKARVMSIWTEYNLKNRDVISLDMVLIDEKGDQIHAVVLKYNISNFQPKLREGEVYYIEKFDTTLRKDSHCPVNHKYRLCLKKNTIVQLAKEESSDVPRYKFNCIELEDLRSRLYVDTYLTDVIGKIVGVSAIQILNKTNGVAVKMRHLDIQNNRGTQMKIKLRADAANQITEEILENPSGSLIVIATSLVVREFIGQLQLNSTNATKLFINLDIPEVLECKEKCGSIPMKGLLESGIPYEKVEDAMLKNRKTISELYEELNFATSQGLSVTCKATITNVIDEYGWYYMSCPSCRHKVSVDVDNKMACYKCKNIEIQIPKPRYRLKLEVEDSTGSATIVLFDQVAETLIQEPCTSLYRLLQKEKGTNEINHKLNKLIRSEHIFRIKLSDYNITQGNKTFTANKVFTMDLKEMGLEASNNKETVEELAKTNGNEDNSETSNEMGFSRKRLCRRSTQHQEDTDLEDF